MTRIDLVSTSSHREDAYAHAVQAGVAVWAVAAAESPFLQEHLDALAELN